MERGPRERHARNLARGLIAALVISGLAFGSQIASGSWLETGPGRIRRDISAPSGFSRAPKPELAAAWRVERRAEVQRPGDPERQGQSVGRNHGGVRFRALPSFEGEATTYADSFDGQMTACGTPLDMESLTAAHPSLPCGTKVLVQNVDDGGRAVVTITDRGPYAEGRILDLTAAAWDRVTNEPPGVVFVRATVLPRT